jgi:hypothetical protein
MVMLFIQQFAARVLVLGMEGAGRIAGMCKQVRQGHTCITHSWRSMAGVCCPSEPYTRGPEGVLGAPPSPAAWVLPAAAPAIEVA